MSNLPEIKKSTVKCLVDEFKNRYFYRAIFFASITAVIYLFGNPPLLPRWFYVHYIPEICASFLVGKFIGIKSLKFPQLNWTYVITSSFIVITVAVLTEVLSGKILAVSIQLVITLGVVVMLILPYVLGYATVKKRLV